MTSVQPRTLQPRVASSQSRRKCRLIPTYLWHSFLYPRCLVSFIAPAGAGPSPRPESSGGRWMRPGWYSFPHGRLFSYFVGPKFQNKGCWMVIRPLSELRTGIAWARDVPVSGWNWYGTEETKMLKASAPTQMMMVFGPLRRQLCVDAPCKGDHGRVEARELHYSSMYLPSFTLAYSSPPFG